MELTITWVIIGINVVISLMALNDRELFDKLKFNPYMVTVKKEWWRVFTHAFVHADYMHLGFNMFVLYMFGRNLEAVFISEPLFTQVFPNIEYWGEAKGIIYYILLYLSAIVAASIPTFIKRPHDSSYNAVGASGAVYAVLMASILLFPLMPLRFIFVPIDIRAFILGPLMLILENYLDKRGGGRIAHDAHLWGGLFGLVFIIAIKPQFIANFFWQIKFYLEGLF